MSDFMLVDSDDDFAFEEADSDFDVENEAPKKGASKGKSTATATKASTAAKVKSKKATAAKKVPAKKALADKSNGGDDDDDDDDAVFFSSDAKRGQQEKTVEERYQKKTQLEHILLRPDTYIGSVKSVTQPMLVRSSETGKIIEREITFVPGLFKIFDEIVVNAADNKQRDPAMDKLEIEIDAAANTISVLNNGTTIPVVIHKEHQCYVPTLILGHLLTGSNFDDNEKKTTGGRNGYGAKLANIFSTEFVIECIDTQNKLKFQQVFRNNMTVAEDPIVHEIKSSAVLKAGDKTKITFKPDLEKFSMTGLDRDIVDLLSKRAYDIAAAMSNASGKRLIVSLNGEKIPVKNFKDYIGMFESIQPPAALEKINDRWEVGVGPSADGTFQQISFVNAICTYKGGQHVNYVADKVAARLVQILKKKNKGGADIKPAQIKNHLCIFVNCLIENPTFDSQTKEFLTSRPKEFGSDCELPDTFLKKIEKSGIVDNILSFVRFKQDQAMNKNRGSKKKKLTGIAKLDDANFAGSAKSHMCTLILTEGDSAKSLAMSGISVVGRDYYGCFPLKGKPLNVRDATYNAITNNEEIKNLVDIIGLKYHQKYDQSNVKTLRYGHLMIMADQDSDGSHIVGLIINLIHHFWPSLLDVDGFLQRFITPIVRVTKGKTSKAFFTLPEYETWKEVHNNGKGWITKYYKGLGTSTSNEAKEYFSNLDKHELNFAEISEDIKHMSLSDDGATGEDPCPMVFDDSRPNVIPSRPITGSDLIDMAFNKTRVEDRKVWLNNIQESVFLDYAAARSSGGIQYSDFINKELILFSKADNIRSIPHLIDGFKPSQRKVMFSCFKRKLKDEVKVAQLAGYVGEHSAYHHGEASLNGAIVALAQSFCGSNNINFLSPCGQFGTRRMGGKDSASPRYIYTKLEKITRAIFHPDDDALLTYLNDDGLSIEPEFYVPVIPVILVNGADGIGTGWSCKIPNYDPRAVIANIRKKIRGEDYEKMHPSYCGFTGSIVLTETIKNEKKYVVSGRIERVDDTTLEITELPLRTWTQDYKEFLEGMLVGDKDKKAESEIIDFKENHTDDTVAFTITATKENIDEFEKAKGGLLGKFKLQTTFTISNMHLFDKNGCITKYDTPEVILDAFYEVRCEFYSKRKAMLLDNLRSEQLILRNKARFVEEVCNGDLVVSNRKRAEILADLQRRGYDLVEKGKKTAEDDDEENVEEDKTSDAELAKGYEYLLGMKIWSLTMEKVQQLQDELRLKTQAVEELEKKTPTDLWLSDLLAVEQALDERDLEMAASLGDERKAQLKSQKRQQRKANDTTKGKKKAAKEWNSNSASSDEEIINLSDSEEEFKATARPAAKQRAPKKDATAKAPAAALKKSSNPRVGKKTAAGRKKEPQTTQASTTQICDEDFDAEKAEAPAKFANMESIVSLEDKEDEELFTLSLADRMKKSQQPSTSELKIPSSTMETANDVTGRKRLSPKYSAAEDEIDFEASSSSKAVAAKKKPRQAAVKPKSVKGKPKGATNRQKSVDSDGSESEEEVAAPPLRAPSSRAARSRIATAKVNYAVDLLSDSEMEDLVDSDVPVDEDSESDFE